MERVLQEETLNIRSLKMLTQEDRSRWTAEFLCQHCVWVSPYLNCIHIVGPDHVCDWFCENISVTTVTFALDLI